MWSALGEAEAEAWAVETQASQGSGVRPCLREEGEGQTDRRRPSRAMDVKCFKIALPYFRIGAPGGQKAPATENRVTAI